MNLKLEKSVERLLSKDYIRLSKEQVSQFLSSGQWTEETFVDILEQHAKINPEQIAVIDEDGKVTTYEELNRNTTKLALSLLRLGIGPDDRIAIQLPNWTELVIALLGAAKARILPAFCHVPYTENDLDYVVGLTDTKAIIIPDNYKNKNFLDVIEKVKDKHNCLKHIIVVSEERYKGTINFYDLMKDEAESTEINLDEVKPVGTDPFFIMFTSGTTGKPKAVLHLHSNVRFFVSQLSKSTKVRNNEKIIVVPPLAHLTGLAVGVLAPLFSGNSTVLLSSWDVGKAAVLIKEIKPTYLVGVTPMLIDLVRYEKFEEKDFSSLKNIIYAGTSCPASILDIYSQRLGCNTFAFYGCTEGGVTHGTRSGDDTSLVSTSFGKSVESVEAKILDDRGNEQRGPCAGEVVMRGPNFSPGYYHQPENNKKMFDEEGWFKSSDLVRMDENGYCTYLGRKDDLINRGGYKIDPIEIEEALYSHQEISQVAVVAMPDERLGERIAVFIILKDGSKILELNEITAFLQEKGISKKHWPEAIKIVDKFPMTASGKIQRSVIREQAKELAFIR